MAISGMNNNNYLFSSGNVRNNNLAGLTSSLFGSGSSMLGDYAMIKSGTYKKLLTAYYKTERVSSESSDSETTTKKSNRYDRFAEKKQMEAQAKKSEENNKYVTIRNEAGDLRTSAYALNSYTLYREKTAEDGTTSYDRDGIKTAVKNFVSDYNNLLTASSKVDSTSMASGVATGISGLMKQTKSNEAALNAIGISIGKDNKLVLDEEKLGSADVNSISSLFKGSSSYGNSVSTKASEIARQANTTAFNATRISSSYSQRGNYSVTGYTNNILDQFL